MEDFIADREKRRDLVVKRTLIATPAIVLALTLFAGSVRTIDQGEKGLITRFGTTQDVKNSGIMFKIPFVDGLHKFSVRTEKEIAQASASSKDLQNVTTEVAVQYNLDSSDQNIKRTYANFGDGNSYVDKIIKPAIQEAVKAASAQFSAEELITKRGEVKRVIEELLSKRLGEEGIHMSNTDVQNFKFSEEFDRAIEQKVTAEQNALASKNKLEQIKYEGEQKVIAAKADAESIKVKSQVLKDYGEKVLTFEAIKKWNGELPNTIAGDNAIPFINIK